jgi:hypothetical protein
VSQRRRELFKAAMKIHGGTSNSSAPAEIGLIDTALTKSSKKTLLETFSSSSKVKRVVTKLHKGEVVKYESNNYKSTCNAFFKGLDCLGLGTLLRSYPSIIAPIVFPNRENVEVYPDNIHAVFKEGAPCAIHKRRSKFFNAFLSSYTILLF